MIRLEREDLYRLVWEKPMTEIAKQYAISDVGLRKACLRLNIPIPKAGHWAKTYAGQQLKKPALPLKCKGQPYVDLEERPPEQPVKKVSELDLLTKQIAKEKLPFRVPNRLSNPDPLIIAAKESLYKKTDVNHPGMAVTATGELDIRVAPVNITRALRFMDTLIKLIRARRHRFESNASGCYIIIRDTSLKVCFREKTTRHKITHKPYQDFEWLPNGKLAFKLDGRLRAEWQDLKTRNLEDQLPKILAKLELVAKQEEEYQEKTRLWQIAWEKERKAQAERETRRRQELRDIKQLLSEAKLWKKAQLLREYIGAMEHPNDEWFRWAHQKADWIDPLNDSEDDWLLPSDKSEL
ncbi:hypothetical protein [Mucilaginibacter defluvii]|uniref:Uncharacterized protein n=1 Tax=Mucilaginibacter defluvii TaxID=1196019 RepID=A0ABP9G1J6_9SPHI